MLHITVFTSAKGIDSSIKKLGYRRKYKNGYKSHFIFATDNEKISLQSTKQANKVKLGYPVNKPWFEYNQKDGQYYRFQYGKNILMTRTINSFTAQTL